MATNTGITFDEDALHPVRTLASEHATGADTDYGFVFQRTVSIAKDSTRARSRVGTFGRRRSRSRARSDIDEEDTENAAMPVDFRTKQSFRGRQLLFLAYQSIGVIYGDIGTSPLYVYSSIFSAGDPSNDDLVGALSLIIWSLLWMVTLKYTLIVLRADNNGEGGSFSAYCLLARYARITNVDPKEKSIRMERHKTNDLPRANRKLRDLMESSLFFRGVLKTIGVLAVSMVLSDGVLTPPQSMLGAYQGLNVAANVSNGQVVGATCGTLVLLFLIQPLGTTKIGTLFAPVVIIWLGLNGGIGIFNLVKYDWTVLRAFNPGLGFQYLIRNGHDGWVSLGGVLLAFTGVEALFADLGAFSMRAIQLSWLGWCLPMLLLTYAGQAAYISVNPDAVAYPVFNTAPDGMLIVMIVFAILAGKAHLTIFCRKCADVSPAIVASQAIITATFQLLAQIIKLSYFPTISIVHTSQTYHNQLYVPLINWLLMIGCILVAAIYNNTTSLGNAYGVCVIFVAFFDTLMVTLVSLIVWKKPIWLVILPALAFASFDAAFLSSALVKVPDGAWFTLTLAAVLAALFILWRYGKENQWVAEAEDRIPLSKFVHEQDGKLRLVQLSGETLSQSNGFGVFFDKVGDKTPIVFSQYMEKLAVLPQISVFLNLRPVESPTVPEAERYWVSKMKLKNCYRIVIRYGYLDRVISENLAGVCHMQIRRFLLARHADGDDATDRRVSEAEPQATVSDEKDTEVASNGKPNEITSSKESQSMDTSLEESLAWLDNAFLTRALYIVGKEEIVLSPKMPILKKLVLGTFLFIRHNTRTKMHNLSLPTERLVEIGFIKELS